MTEALKIKEIAGQAGLQNDCKIYDIYKHKDRLQVFIEKNSKQSAVNLKDCENVFHSLQFLLDVELPHVLKQNRLEVSSPGIEKQLREKWHFKDSVGQLIKLTSHSPLKAKNLKTGKSFYSQFFKAYLLSVCDKSLTLKTPVMECVVDFSDIKYARVIFNNSQLKTKEGFENKQKGRG